MEALTAALAQVAALVQADDNERFTTSMGAFHEMACAKTTKLSALRTETETACTDMLRWLGEDAKAQPEDAFSSLHNFLLSLEKAHRYNAECDAKDAKKSARNAAQSIGAPGGSRASVETQVAAAAVPAPLSKALSKPKGVAFSKGGPPQPPAAGMGVSSELAAKLAAKRSQAAEGGGGQGGDLVDGVAKGMANGLRVRALSRDRLTSTEAPKRPVLKPPPGAQGGGKPAPPAPFTASGSSGVGRGKKWPPDPRESQMRRGSNSVSDHI